jgi:hypothetical protein
VHHDSVPVAGKPQQLGQLQSGSFPAGRFASEDPVQSQAIGLAFLVLV